MEIRFPPYLCRQLRRPRNIFLSPSTNCISFRERRASTQRPEQANPLGDYYESLLSQPLPWATSATRQPTTPSPPISLPKTDKEETLAKARIVFGSRLAGPADRRSEIERKSTLIAGVWVPPRPEEPDNCCMSGCVNCVYDRYRDELEEWSSARRAADANLRKEKGLEDGRSRRRKSVPDLVLRGVEEKDAQQAVTSGDDELGDSEANPTTEFDPELFKGIPVGILEFMKTEKRLKEKHVREGTKG